MKQAQAGQFHVFYKSTLRGQATPDNDRPLCTPSESNIAYFGTCYQIPPVDLATERQYTKELQPSELVSPPPIAEGYRSVPDGPLERYEVFDRQTGNLWIMWRVPFKPTDVDVGSAALRGIVKGEE